MSSLEATIDYAEQGGVKCRDWVASKPQTEYAAALCKRAIDEVTMGLAWDSLEAAYTYAAKNTEDGENVEHGVVSGPFALAFAAISAAGIWPQVAQAIRLSIVESNGCISILANGTLACSLSSAEWKRRLQLARGVKAEPTP